jgi:hypothetical protein
MNGMRSATSLNNTTGAEANYKVCLIGVGDFSMRPTQEHIARSEAQRKPWLVGAWRERRIVAGQGVRGVFAALALAVTGPMPIIGVAVGIRAMVDGHLSGLKFIFAGAMFAIFPAFVTYLWLKERKSVNSVLHLETLPGVIGGWFKASVEVNLPVETLPTVLVKLKNMFAEGRKGKDSGFIWEISQRVFPAQLTRIQGDRYLIPVRFYIPARKDYYTDTGAGTGYGYWHLKITAELPGVNLDVTFNVPIFETDEAPPEEQTPEGGLWIVEVVYDKRWYHYDKPFVSKLIAKAGRENTFTGYGRKREKDLGWYFKTEAEAQECANKFRGDPTLRVRVYDGAHQ